MRETEEFEALEARCTALENLCEPARDGSPASVRSVRRILRSMEPLLDLQAPELAERARRAREVPDGELPARIGSFVQAVRDAIGELPRDVVRILLIDDDPDRGARIRRTLDGPSREIVRVASAAEADEGLGPEPPDLVVLQLGLSGADGRDLLVGLLDRPAAAATPVVVLSDRSDPATRAECFALGADEVLEHPVHDEVLSAVVSSMLRRRAALTRMAQEDHLTGLPNRAAFVRIFARLQSLAVRHEEPLTLVLMDVDHLKEVNDRLGHRTGDRILQELSRVVQDQLRDSDVLARWGGDEFVVLLPNTDGGGTRSALDKARRKLREVAGRDPELTAEGLELSFSGGVTAVRDGEPVEDAVARADHLLYQAKTLGRDHLVTEEAADAESPEVLLVEDEDTVADVFRRFLERGGFQVRRVSTGDQALRSVRERPPDLVVLDVMIPGKNGFEVLQEMRDDPDLRDLPVLMLTGLGQNEAVARGFSLGVDEYLVKPVSREEFLTKVRRLVRP